MENRNTEGNFDEDNDSSNENEDYAEDEEQETEEVEKGAEEENSMKTPEVKVVTPRLGTLKSKKYDDKKISHFESQLVDFLKTKQSDDDPDKSFLMSLLPKLKSLNEDQKVTVQIKMLNIFRKIKNPQPLIHDGPRHPLPNNNNMQLLHPPSPYSHAQNPSDSHPTYTQTYSNYSQNNSSLQYSQNRHSSYDSQIGLNRNYTSL